MAGALAMLARKLRVLPIAESAIVAMAQSLLLIGSLMPKLVSMCASCPNRWPPYQSPLYPRRMETSPALLLQK